MTKLLSLSSDYRHWFNFWGIPKKVDKRYQQIPDLFSKATLLKYQYVTLSWPIGNYLLIFWFNFGWKLTFFFIKLILLSNVKYIVHKWRIKLNKVRIILKAYRIILIRLITRNTNFTDMILAQWYHNLQNEIKGCNLMFKALAKCFLRLPDLQTS